LLTRPRSLTMRVRRIVCRYPILFFTYFAWSKIKLHLRKRWHRNHVHKAAQQIYAPHGSFLLIHDRYFRAGGTLDYGSFLFVEEIFLAESAARLDLPIVYEPSFVIYHRQHASTGHWPNKCIRGYVADSSAFLYDHYFRAPLARDRKDSE